MSAADQSPTPRAAWRERLRIIIFEADTPAGKIFDVVLLVAILLSILVVLLESVSALEDDYGDELMLIEWLFTGLFSIEYGLRLVSAPRASRYARSFFGIVDLLSILPSFISLVLPGARSMLVIRALRLMRTFRIFKLARFLGEASVLRRALQASIHKITIFLATILILVVILGTTMFLVEGEEHGFTSIPRSMYWAIITMTTVGYGQLTPQTVPGQIIASMVMIVGYGIIAVPTGIVTAEIVGASRPVVTTRVCPECMSEGHDLDAGYCRDCGAALG